MDQGYFGVSDTPSMYQVVVVAFVVSMLVCGRVFITPGIHYHEILVYMLVADASCLSSVMMEQSLLVVINHGCCS